LASKLVATVFSDLASKPVATVSTSLASKLVTWIFRFEPQNRQLRFGNLGLKITVIVSWFVSQNQAGYGLSVMLQNRWEGDGVGHALRFSGLLRVEASRDRIF
jgi:hypothetical protein